MNNDFEIWLQNERDAGLKDIKISISGDTSDVSVATVKQEILCIEALAADASFLESLPKVSDYSDELTTLNAALNG